MWLVACVQLFHSIVHAGKPVNHGEDRICSTAMAVNALLYTWTEKGKLLPDVPDNVTKLVIGASEWLTQNTLSGQYKPFNAVFSGSVKTEDVSQCRPYSPIMM